MGDTVLDILHLSDIHFKKSLDAGDPADVRDRLIDAAGEHFKKYHSVDMVAVTGDVAFSGKKEQYRKALEFFDKLKPLLPDTAPILAVPGNHDVDRDEVNKLFSLHKIVEARNTDDFLNDSRNIRDMLAPKFKAFRAFANKLHPKLYPSPKDYFWTREVPGKKGVALLGLNSAWASENEKDKPFITLGYPQFMEALKRTRKSPYRILMMHHPKDWLEETDFNRFCDEVYEGCALILHGHTHMDGAASFTTPTGSCLLVGSNAAYTHDGYIGFQVLRVTFGKEGVSARIWPYRLETRGKKIFVPDTYRWGAAQGGKPYFDIHAGGRAPGTAKTSKKTAVPLVIPGAYKTWIKDTHGGLETERLDPQKRAFKVTLPDIYIPIETPNPFYTPPKEEDMKKKAGKPSPSRERGEPEADESGEKRAIDIETLAGRVSCLLLQGGPGAGKTTLVKHLAYLLTHQTPPPGLRGGKMEVERLGG